MDKYNKYWNPCEAQLFLFLKPIKLYVETFTYSMNNSGNIYCKCRKLHIRTTVSCFSCYGVWILAKMNLPFWFVWHCLHNYIKHREKHNFLKFFFKGNFISSFKRFLSTTLLYLCSFLSNIMEIQILQIDQLTSAKCN